jgi:4a-hydroxytetrahydrobiopterin dehydratase
MTERITARQVSAAAQALGIMADPAAVQLVNVTIDALVLADVLPFWRAVLGYRQVGDDYLLDPSGRGQDLQRPGCGRSPGFRRVRADVVGPGRS